MRAMKRPDSQSVRVCYGVPPMCLRCLVLVCSNIVTSPLGPAHTVMVGGPAPRSMCQHRMDGLVESRW